MTISFNEISAGVISVLVMSYDPDYADCIIPAAEVRTSVAEACGERGGADFRRSRSGVIQAGTVCLYSFRQTV
jgi:hypothetical protein